MQNHTGSKLTLVDDKFCISSERDFTRDSNHFCCWPAYLYFYALHIEVTSWSTSVLTDYLRKILRDPDEMLGSTWNAEAPYEFWGEDVIPEVVAELQHRGVYVYDPDQAKNLRKTVAKARRLRNDYPGWFKTNYRHLCDWTEFYLSRVIAKLFR